MVINENINTLETSSIKILKILRGKNRHEKPNNPIKNEFIP